MTLAVATTEAAFQATLIDLIHLHGYEAMHVRRSIGHRKGGQAWQTTTSVAGWPDLTIFGNGELFFAELKSDTGQLSAEQHVCIDALRAAGQEVHVWQPRDWDAITERLSRHRKAAR